MVAQYFGWPWGKRMRPSRAPEFHVVNMIVLLAGTALVLTTIDPVQLTLVSVVLGAVAIPLTYFPILVVANDRDYLGDKVNGPVRNLLGGLLLIAIVAAAVAAIPLLLLSRGRRAAALQPPRLPPHGPDLRPGHRRRPARLRRRGTRPVAARPALPVPRPPLAPRRLGPGRLLRGPGRAAMTDVNGLDILLAWLEFAVLAGGFVAVLLRRSGSHGRSRRDPPPHDGKER